MSEREPAFVPMAPLGRLKTASDEELPLPMMTIREGVRLHREELARLHNGTDKGLYVLPE